jgi:hypothetical protein
MLRIGSGLGKGSRCGGYNGLPQIACMLFRVNRPKPVEREEDEYV